MVNCRRLTLTITNDYDDDDEYEGRRLRPQHVQKRSKRNLKKEDNNSDDDSVKKKKENEKKVAEHPRAVEDAKPVSEPVRFSGKGRGKKSHYQSFFFNGIQYTLDDSVIFLPEEKGQKPYVAIIKDIAQGNNGNVLVTGQWFYRPQEAEKKNGGNWNSCDVRELFYSFHYDDVHAEAVMHKCVVHFVPHHKQLPNRKDHPGFIVQKVYDNKAKKLWRLDDNDYEDIKQREIDGLIQKTLQRIGELPDIDQPKESPVAVDVDDDEDEEDQIKNQKA